MSDFYTERAKNENKYTHTHTNANVKMLAFGSNNRNSSRLARKTISLKLKEGAKLAWTL